jgi:hypothetical protein
LNQFGSTNKGLTEVNNFLKGTTEDTSALNTDIERQLRASKRQVDRLKGLLTRKVTQFELLPLGEQVQKQSLLEDMIAEKAQVASLQMDLQALNLARLPAPEAGYSLNVHLRICALERTCSFLHTNARMRRCTNLGFHKSLCICASFATINHRVYFY